MYVGFSFEIIHLTSFNMLSVYIVNAEAFDKEGFKVHTNWCDKLPPLENQLSLGRFNDCWGAIKRANALDIDAEACYHCCKECHVEDY